MRFCFPVVSAALLAACSAPDEEEESEGPSEADVMIDDSAESGDLRITSRDGSSVSIDKRAGNDAQWPEGFTAYPGATVTSDIAMDGGETRGKIIGFETASSPSDVAEYYRKEAEAAGFEIDMDLSVNEGRMLSGSRADGVNFAITTSRGEAGTRASLTVGQVK